jgi:hypothetical protein
VSVTFFGPRLRARQSLAYSNNPHTLDELKERFREIFTSIEVTEVKLVSNKFFKRLGSAFKSGREMFLASIVVVCLDSEIHARVSRARHN